MTFKPVELFNNDDVVSLESLNDIITNIDHLNDNKITMSFSTPELVATKNLKVAAGRSSIAPGRASETLIVNFDGFFEPSTVPPVVNVSLETTTRKRAYISVSEVRYDSFRVTIETASGEPFAGRNEVHWIAMGF